MNDIKQHVIDYSADAWPWDQTACHKIAAKSKCTMYEFKYICSMSQIICIYSKYVGSNSVSQIYAAK